MRNATVSVLLSAFAIAAIAASPQTKVSTVPISNDQVVLRLVVGHAGPARVVAFNGGLVRVALRNGPTLGLVPVVRDHGVVVTVMEILTDQATGNEKARQLGKRTVPLGSSTNYADARLSVDIGLAEMRTAATVAAMPVVPASPCIRCCVTCGDLTVCSCGVEMDCGKCCCQYCCEGTAAPSSASSGGSVAGQGGCVASGVRR